MTSTGFGFYGCTKHSTSYDKYDAYKYPSCAFLDTHFNTPLMIRCYDKLSVIRREGNKGFHAIPDCFYALFAGSVVFEHN